MAVKRVGAAEAAQLLRVGYKVIDVRAPQEYKKGHPSGAVNIPIKLFNASGGYKSNADFLAVVEASFAKDIKLLVVGKIGKRSLEAAEILVEAGYETVFELRPGYIGLVNKQGRYDEDGWTTLGLPTEEVTRGGSYQELKEKLPSAL